jgi:hypothetical protein
MSLSDRLQRAQTERLIAKGYLSSEHALKPEPEAEPEPETETAAPDGEGLFAPITIEVLSSGLHVVAEAPSEYDIAGTSDHPNMCPKCNTAGTLDLVDLVGHTMHLTCPSCGTMWQVRQPDDVPITP